MRRQLGAVMFTDLVGYTALVGRDEAAGLEARGVHRTAVEEAVGAAGGELLQYFGDGSLSVFPSALVAVQAAHGIQRAFMDRPELELRIGLDLGEIAFDDQGAVGHAVNVASRLESLCPPGGVLLSESVRRELRNHPEVAVHPLGAVRLKNVPAPVPVFALKGEGLRPPPEGSFLPLSSRPPDPTSGAPEPHRIIDALWRQAQPGVAPAAVREPEGGFPRELPLVGRHRELERLLATADDILRTRTGRAIFLSGDRGVGKTRLSASLSRELGESGWLVARGQAFPTGMATPFAPLADALGGLLKSLTAQELEAILPGGWRTLIPVVPALSLQAGFPDSSELEIGDRTRLFWVVSQLLDRISHHRPLLVLLEDLQWADASSVELMHFLLRHSPTQRVLFLLSHCEAEVDPAGDLRGMLPALRGLPQCVETQINPLSEGELQELLVQTFGVEQETVAPFTSRLFRHTRGNPFLTEATLQNLAGKGLLYLEGGRWLGWEIRDMEVPPSVRDSIRLRLSQFSSAGQRVAEAVAVAGGNLLHEVLLAAVELESRDVVEGLRELTAANLLVEEEAGGEVRYRFTHPLMQEAIQSAVPKVLAREVHARVARSIEDHYGPSAMGHADVLAYHFCRAPDGGSSGKATDYLQAAGEAALRRFAFKEAIQYLEAALRRLPPQESGADSPADGSDPPDIARRRLAILRSLAKSQRRAGKHEDARASLRRALGEYPFRTEPGLESDLRRQLALSLLSGGAIREGWKEFELAGTRAEEADDKTRSAAVHLARGVSFQHLGDAEQAMVEVSRAEVLAREVGDRSLEARVQRARLLVHLWNGEFGRATESGLTLRRLANELEDPVLAFWVEWTLAAASGLRGDTGDLQARLPELERIAEELNAPDLQLWAAELALEDRYSSGEWELALGLGEQAVALARAIDAQAVLPRLLVWLALVYIGHGDLDRADRLTEEAWTISGADRAGDGSELLNIHAVVPAHIGRTAYQLALGDWEEAIRVGAQGLALVERAGYVAWAVHRLLPLLIEAHLYAGNVETAERLGRKLKEYGEATDHSLARAWGAAGEGIVIWLRGDAAAGMEMMAEAAARLEEIPQVLDAARLRRQVAGRMWDLGRREEAVKEIRRAYAVLERLGAKREMERALVQFDEMGLPRP